MINGFLNNQLQTKVIKLAFLVSFLALVFGSEAKESTDKVREFIHQEAQATNELQRGVARLARLCAAPLKPEESFANSDALRDTTSRIQVRSKALAKIAEQQYDKILEILANAKQDQIQICSRKNWINGQRGRTPIANLDGSCEVANSHVAQVEDLRTLVSKWKEIQAQRQKLFERLLSLEASRCTRAGFAQRMFQAHESALGNFEDELPSWIENALGKEDTTRARP